MVLLFGNDYLPGLPTFNSDINCPHFGYGGRSLPLKYLFFIYGEVFKKVIFMEKGKLNFIFLINHQENNSTINTYFLNKVFELLVSYEYETILKTREKISNDIIRAEEELQNSTFTNECEDIWKKPFICPIFKPSGFNKWPFTPLKRLDAEFKLFKVTSFKDYRYDFNNKYFGKSSPYDVSKRYLIGLKIMIKNYFDLDFDFNWYYPYPYSPLVSDLHGYLRMNHVLFNSVPLPGRVCIDKYVRQMLNNDMSRIKKLPDILKNELLNKIATNQDFKRYYVNFKEINWIVGEQTKRHKVLPRLPECNNHMIQLFNQLVQSKRHLLTPEEQAIVGVDYL